MKPRMLRYAKKKQKKFNSQGLAERIDYHAWPLGMIQIVLATSIFVMAQIFEPNNLTHYLWCQ